LIDRQKRILNKLITYSVLYPLGIFFLLCFGRGRHWTGRTILEIELGFETYWRTIGVVGAIVVLLLLVFLDRLIVFKKGQIQLTRDKIIIKKENTEKIFHTNRLKNFEFKADIPFDSDDRDAFQKQSVLRFTDSNEKFIFEINLETVEDSKTLTP